MSDNFEDNDARTWAMICHASSLLTYTGIGAPAFILGPLIVWMVKGDSHPLIKENGRSAVNFNLTILFAVFALCALLCTGIGALIAIPGLLLLSVFHIVFTIIAAIRAREGVVYAYPLCLKLF